MTEYIYQMQKEFKNQAIFCAKLVPFQKRLCTKNSFKISLENIIYTQSELLLRLKLTIGIAEISINFVQSSASASFVYR